jgi:O-antigen ligase
MVLLVGTEAGRLVTALRVVGAVVGTALIVAYLVRAPRDHDLVDALVLAGLVLFLVTCVTSSTPRLSFEAATTALAYAAAFWVARGALSDPRGRELGVLALGALGTLLGIMFVVNWGAVWIDWITIVGGLPPLDLALPSAPYAGIHAAILAGLLLPATVVLARRRWLWPMGIAGSVALLAAIVMSGSRSVWLGLALSALALAAMGAGRVVFRAPRVLLGGLGVITVALLAVLGPMVLTRIATGSTVELRLVMWGESIEHWMRAPLVGHGPGTFAARFNLTDYYNRFEPWHTHPHNLVVQVLVESGVVGLVGVALILVALVIGVRRQGRLEWAALTAVVFIAGVGLTENATISAYLVAPLIVWAAMATPRIRQDPHAAPAPARALRQMNLGLATVVLLAVGSTLVAAFAHDRAVAAERAGNEAEVTASLRQAASFDPAMPLYHRELGLWLMAAGDHVNAEAEVRRALELNPADSATLRTLALVRLATDDGAQALATAKEAHRRADLHPENALTLAYVAGEIGDPDAQSAALVRAVRRYPWLLAAPEWDILFPGVDKEALLAEARDSWADQREYSHRNLQARTWLMALSNDGLATDMGDAEAAESALLRCEPSVAAGSLGDLTAAQAANSAALQARLMVGRAFDRFLDRAEEAQLLTLLAAHNPGIVRMATDGVGGAAAASDHNADVAVYARVPVRPPVGPILPTPSSGLSAWLRDPIAAADVGAPASRLATCR